jgi:probable rRNA maturation factor
VSIVITTDDEIRVLNSEYRNIDSVTDILSFAMRDGDNDDFNYGDDEFNGPELLGDIVISVETAVRQANEYGHSLTRELGFLTVHGILHLLGFDHIEEDDRRDMRNAEEGVLSKFGISRE